VARQRQRAVLQFQFLFEGLGRLRQTQRIAPSTVFRRGIRRHRYRRDHAVGRRLALRACRRRKQIDHAVAVGRRESVDINQPRDAGSRAVGDAGRNHAAIGMADQADMGQILERQHAENIRDMRVEIDVGPRQVPALAEAGKSRRDQPVPARGHQRVHLLPGPAGAPGSRRHARQRM